MVQVKTLIVALSALAFAAALGWLAYHYVAVTEQYMRMLML
jgi:hypothetical protein